MVFFCTFGKKKVLKKRYNNGGMNINIDVKSSCIYDPKKIEVIHLSNGRLCKDNVIVYGNYNTFLKKEKKIL